VSTKNFKSYLQETKNLKMSLVWCNLNLINKIELLKTWKKELWVKRDLGRS